MAKRASTRCKVLARCIPITWLPVHGPHIGRASPDRPAPADRGPTVDGRHPRGSPVPRSAGSGRSRRVPAGRSLRPDAVAGPGPRVIPGSGAEPSPPSTSYEGFHWPDRRRLIADGTRVPGRIPGRGLRRSPGNLPSSGRTRTGVFQCCRTSDSQASTDSSSLPRVALSTQVHRVWLNVSFPSVFGQAAVTVGMVAHRSGRALLVARAPGFQENKRDVHQKPLQAEQEKARKCPRI